MQALTPLFKVWIATDASGSEWALVLTTADLEEAAAFFEQQSNNNAYVAVYERGRFQEGGKSTIGFVGFAWSANLNGYMEGAPLGRGHGWTEANAFVTYEYPAQNSSEQVVGPDYAHVASPWSMTPAVYEAQEQCQRCGRLTSLSQLRCLTHDVQTGHSSGTHRQSRSNSNTNSRWGVSNTSRRSSGYTSGRRYYRREQLLLCNECYPLQISADRSEKVKSFFWNLLGL